MDGHELSEIEDCGEHSNCWHNYQHTRCQRYIAVTHVPIKAANATHATIQSQGQARGTPGVIPRATVIANTCRLLGFSSHWALPSTQSSSSQPSPPSKSKSGYDTTCCTHTTTPSPGRKRCTCRPAPAARLQEEGYTLRALRLQPHHSHTQACGQLWTPSTDTFAITNAPTAPHHHAAPKPLCTAHTPAHHPAHHPAHTPAHRRKALTMGGGTRILSARMASHGHNVCSKGHRTRHSRRRHGSGAQGPATGAAPGTRCRGLWQLGGGGGGPHHRAHPGRRLPHHTAAVRSMQHRSAW